MENKKKNIWGIIIQTLINPAKRKASARKNEKRFSQQKRKVLLKLDVLPLWRRHTNGIQMVIEPCLNAVFILIFP